MATKKNKAIAESKEGKALQKLLKDSGAIDIAVLNELLASKGLKAVAAGLAEARYSRVEHQRRWMTATEITEDELIVIKQLPDILGKSHIVASEQEADEFVTLPEVEQQERIDLWMEEELCRRKVADMVGERGRWQAARATFFNLASARNDGDPFATDSFPSPKHGYRFSVIKQERGGEANYSALEGVLDAKTWETITDPVITREVNEEKLTKALAEGKITVEQFQMIIPDKTISRTLRVDPIKPGDSL